MKHWIQFNRHCLAAVAFCLVGAACGQAAPGELALQAQLIWGTDGGRPRGQNLKDLDATTRDKLKGVFKWKDYYEIDRQDFKVPMSSKKRIRMSPKCEIEVENLGDAAIEVNLYGEGKLVVKKKQIIKPGELLVLAGDDKNNTAWFVILSLVKR